MKSRESNPMPLVQLGGILPLRLSKRICAARHNIHRVTTCSVLPILDLVSAAGSSGQHHSSILPSPKRAATFFCLPR